MCTNLAALLGSTLDYFTTLKPRITLFLQSKIKLERVMGIEPTFRLVLRSLGEECLTQNHLLN